MCGRFLILLVAIPVVELALLIRVGGQIGVLSTVWLVALTAAVGMYFVRQQGLSVLRDLQSSGAQMSARMLEGPLLAIAAVCLLIPGFVTDACGALLLLPPLRSAFARAWASRLRTGTQRTGGIQFTIHGRGEPPFGGGGRFDPRQDDEDTVVTIVEKAPEKPMPLPRPDESDDPPVN